MYKQLHKKIETSALLVDVKRSEYCQSNLKHNQFINRFQQYHTFNPALKMYICLVLFPVMTFSGQNEMESAETRLHLETKSTIVKSYVLRKTSLKYQPTEHQKYYRRSAEQLKYYRRY